jgi:hypothetical protein
LPLPYGGKQLITPAPVGIAVPTPIESLQHPLSVYDLVAQEVGA